MSVETERRLRLLLAVRTRELKTAFYLALSDQSSVHVVASATSTAELMSYHRTFQPDAIALEWEIPGRPMKDLLPELIQSEPAPEILIISRPSSREEIRRVAPSGKVFDDPGELIDTLNDLQAEMGVPTSTVNEGGPHQS